MEYPAFDEELTGLEHLLLVARRLKLPEDEARLRVAELLLAFDLAEVAGQPVRTYPAEMRRRLDRAGDRLDRPEVVRVRAGQALDVRPADPADLDTVSMLLADVIGVAPVVYGNDGGLVSVPVHDMEVLPAVVTRLRDWDVPVAELALRAI